MKKKEDLRIRKTKANIYRALLELMKNNNFDEIKIIDICKKSSINRSTFYDHFNDKYEILQELMKEMQEEFITNLEIRKGSYNRKEYLLEITKQLLEYLEKKKELYFPIFNREKNNNILSYDSFIDGIIKEVANNLDEINDTNIPTILLSQFYISGIMKVSIESMKKDNSWNQKELLQEFDKIIDKF